MRSLAFLPLAGGRGTTLCQVVAMIYFQARQILYFQIQVGGVVESPHQVSLFIKSRGLSTARQPLLLKQVIISLFT